MRLTKDDARSIIMINQFIDLGFQVVAWPDRHKDCIEVRLYSGEWTTGYQRLPRLVHVSGPTLSSALQEAGDRLESLLAER